jgi:hypothetical protein
MRYESLNRALVLHRRGAEVELLYANPLAAGGWRLRGHARHPRVDPRLRDHRHRGVSGKRMIGERTARTNNGN